MLIRRFNDEDATNVSNLIITTLRTSNIKDYTAEYIENGIKHLQPIDILERSK